MFTWAKELLSPTVQTGKPVSEPSSNERRKSKSSDADGEVTEEGFVCVGKSSFYKSPEMPALVQTSNPSQVPDFHGGGGGGGAMMISQSTSTMYPILPYPLPMNTQQVPTAVGVDNGDLVRQIPFSLRNGLSSGGMNGQRQHQKPYEVYLSPQFRSQFRERYDYDFGLERGVLRELSHQAPECYY